MLCKHILSERNLGTAHWSPKKYPERNPALPRMRGKGTRRDRSSASALPCGKTMRNFIGTIACYVVAILIFPICLVLMLVAAVCGAALPLGKRDPLPLSSSDPRE